MEKFFALAFILLGIPAIISFFIGCLFGERARVLSFAGINVLSFIVACIGSIQEFLKGHIISEPFLIAMFYISIAVVFGAMAFINRLQEETAADTSLIEKYERIKKENTFN